MFAPLSVIVPFVLWWQCKIICYIYFDDALSIDYVAMLFVTRQQIYTASSWIFRREGHRPSNHNFLKTTAT